MKRWLIIGLLALLPAVAYGQAGTRTWFIDPDAVGWSDYSSLAALDAAKARDLTSADSIYIAECMCSGGTASTTTWTASGSWVTDATRYIKAWTNPDSTYRHNGTYQTGNKYRIPKVSQRQISLTGSAAHVYLIGLQFIVRAADYSQAVYADPSADGWTYIEQCVVDGNDSDLSEANRVGIVGAEFGHTVYVSNTVIYDIARGINKADGVLRSANNVVDNATVGYRYNTTVKNCIAEDCVTDFAAPTSQTTNYAGDDVVFVNKAGHDYHLASGDATCRENGTDLSADGDYAITLDIDGETRPISANWDIGADEGAAAAAGGQVVIVN